MMSTNGIREGTIPREIRAGPAAIRSTLAEALPAAREAASSLLEDGVRRVYIFGNGTSFHTSLAAAHLFRLHALEHDPVVLALPAGELHHYLPALGKRDAVVGVSASGEFRDVLAVMEEVKGSSPTVGIVHSPESSLGRLADHLVVSAGGPTMVPVMTKTFSATLTAAYLFVAELLAGSRAESIESDLLRAAEWADASITQSAERVGSFARSIAGYEHVLVYGGGGAFVAALEASLKLKETARIHAEGAETWEMGSGGATIVSGQTAVLAIAPEGRGRDWTDDLTRHCSKWGALTIEVSPSPAVDGSLLLPLDPEAMESLSPLFAVPPVALLAYELGVLRGLEPDRPAWTERYRCQGLRHVVGA